MPLLINSAHRPGRDPAAMAEAMAMATEGLGVRIAWRAGRLPLRQEGSGQFSRFRGWSQAWRAQRMNFPRACRSANDACLLLPSSSGGFCDVGDYGKTAAA